MCLRARWRTVGRHEPNHHVPVVRSGGRVRRARCSSGRRHRRRRRRRLSQRRHAARPRHFGCRHDHAATAGRRPHHRRGRCTWGRGCARLVLPRPVHEDPDPRPVRQRRVAGRRHQRHVHRHRGHHGRRRERQRQPVRRWRRRDLPRRHRQRRRRWQPGQRHRDHGQRRRQLHLGPQAMATTSSRATQASTP